MDSNNKLINELVFSEWPRVTLRSNECGNSLVRIIDETPIAEEEGKEVGEMTWKQHILYYLFLYNPKKPEVKVVDRVFREEILAEGVSGFEVLPRGKGYVVLYR
jgi:hypothetical protein